MFITILLNNYIKTIPVHDKWNVSLHQHQSLQKYVVVPTLNSSGLAKNEMYCQICDSLYQFAQR